MIEALIIGGLVLAAAGTAVQVAGSIKSREAQKELIREQRQAEANRKAAMEIDANRRRRELIRQSIIARSRALAVTSQQGAAEGSGLGGAFAQIQGQTAFGLGGLSAQEQLGANMFESNQRAFGARGREAEAGTLSSVGTGLSSLGGAAVRSAGAFGRITG